MSESPTMYEAMKFKNAADKLMGVKLDIEEIDFTDVPEMLKAKEGIMDYVMAAHAGLLMMFTMSTLCEATGTDLAQSAAKFFAEDRDGQE